MPEDASLLENLEKGWIFPGHCAHTNPPPSPHGGGGGEGRDNRASKKGSYVALTACSMIFKIICVSSIVPHIILYGVMINPTI